MLVRCLTANKSRANFEANDETFSFSSMMAILGRVEGRGAHLRILRAPDFLVPMPLIWSTCRYAGRPKRIHLGFSLLNASASMPRPHP